MAGRRRTRRRPKRSATHAERLAAEVLATELTEGAPPAGASELFEAGDEELGLRLWLRRVSG